MSHSRSDAIQARVVNRLTPHGSEGSRAVLNDVIDLEALEHEQYHDVLDTVDARLSRARSSLISMLIAGIYFGLLVGLWLVDFSSWTGLLQWLLPLLIVAVYGGISTHQQVVQIRQLSEARALLSLLTDSSPGNA